MSPKSTKATEKSKAPLTGSASVTLRIRRDHLAEVDAMAAEDGTSRAAQIQIAIAKHIKREAK